MDDTNPITDHFIASYEGWDEQDSLVHSYYNATLVDSGTIPKAYRGKTVDVVNFDYGKGIVEAYRDKEDSEQQELLFKLTYLPTITDVRMVTKHHASLSYKGTSRTNNG